ncbi:MAG: hypothetical protein HGA36_04020 [Candidatus Moranbacteria bacterium]|nr:hypothetical protein [Candidatus Moranbacteria bacterium]
MLEHLWIVIVVLVLTVPFKAAALWRAARRGHVGWFLSLMVLNTLAILDIIYIFIFSGEEVGKKNEQNDQQQDEFKREPQDRQHKFSSSSKSRTTIL